MRKITYSLLSVLALGGLLFAYYTISPLFRSIQVNEPSPEAVRREVIQTPPVQEEAQREAVQASQLQEEIRTTQVVGTSGHAASGAVRIVVADGETYLRYENFKTINGPDLYVYLAKDLDAKEYVSLGVLRATEGNINYKVPEDVDITSYRYALVWCKQFSE